MVSLAGKKKRQRFETSGHAQVHVKMAAAELLKTPLVARNNQVTRQSVDTMAARHGVNPRAVEAQLMSRGIEIIEGAESQKKKKK